MLNERKLRCRRNCIDLLILFLFKHRSTYILNDIQWTVKFYITENPFINVYDQPELGHHYRQRTYNLHCGQCLKTDKIFI